MLSSQHCQRFPGCIPLPLWVQGQRSNNKQQRLFTVAPTANCLYQHALHCQETNVPSTLDSTQPSAAARLHKFLTATAHIHNTAAFVQLLFPPTT